jgi:hypothetical protein
LAWVTSERAHQAILLSMNSPLKRDHARLCSERANATSTAPSTHRCGFAGQRMHHLVERRFVVVSLTRLLPSGVLGFHVTTRSSVLVCDSAQSADRRAHPQHQSKRGNERTTRQQATNRLSVHSTRSESIRVHKVAHSQWCRCRSQSRSREHGERATTRARSVAVQLPGEICDAPCKDSCARCSLLPLLSLLCAPGKRSSIVREQCTSVCGEPRNWTIQQS